MASALHPIGRALAATLLAASPMARADYAYSTLSVPGADQTTINYADGPGFLVGNAFNGNTVHGFVDVTGAITRVDVPGASYTALTAATADHTLVGAASTDGGRYQWETFVDRNGSFTVTAFPGASLLRVNAVNDSGQIVGDAGTPSAYQAFVSTGGAPTWLAPFGVTDSAAYAISASGDVVGAYSVGATTHAFLYSNGTYSEVGPADSANSTATVIAPDGVLGGFTTDAAGQSHGWVDEGGQYLQLDLPGAVSTEIWWVNGSDTFAGDAFLPGRDGPIGFTWKNGVFQTVDPPGSTFSYPDWIDGQGDVVGFSSRDGVNFVGFVATPVPEPASGALWLAGALALAARRWRRPPIRRD